MPPPGPSVEPPRTELTHCICETCSFYRPRWCVGAGLVSADARLQRGGRTVHHENLQDRGPTDRDTLNAHTLLTFILSLYITAILTYEFDCRSAVRQGHGACRRKAENSTASRSENAVASMSVPMHARTDGRTDQKHNAATNHPIAARGIKSSLTVGWFKR